MYLLLVIIAGYIVYIVYRRKTLIKQVDLLNRLLYSEKSPEKYLDEVNKILNKAHTDREKSINLIQKTTGLLYAGKFNEAIGVLSDNIKKIPPNWQHIYYHNLILCLFLDGHIDKGNEVLKEADETLKEYSKKDYNKAAIDLIYAVADFYNGKETEVKEFFKKLADNGRNDYRIAFGYYFLSKINEAEGNYDECEENLEKAKIYGQGSFIE